MFEMEKDKLMDRFEHWGDDIRDEDVMDFSQFDLRESLEKMDSFNLYRYTPINRFFHIRSIEKQTIHLSENGVLNDVYEGISCLGEHYDNNKIHKLNDLAFMTCFSETNKSTLMWSHYTNNHKGVCIEYDLKLLKDSRFDVLKHLFPVIYCEKRSQFKDYDSILESHNELSNAIKYGSEYEGWEPLDDLLPLFLVKGKMWEYEKEWRIVYTKKQMYDYNDETLYSCNLAFPCMTGIYLGYRIEKDTEDYLKEVIERMNESLDQKIKIHKASLSKDSYDICFD